MRSREDEVEKPPASTTSYLEEAIEGILNNFGSPILEQYDSTRGDLDSPYNLSNGI